jgi:threonine/homoserine/homoserine lactone efflux protein
LRGDPLTDPAVNVFIKGLIVGFALAAPVGPIAALCVQRTIAKRWMAGFVSGLGAAVADGLYGLVAAFGATFISEFLITEHEWLQRLGGVILILLGLRLILKRMEPGTEIEVDAKLTTDPRLARSAAVTTNPNGSAGANGKRRGLTGYFLATLVLTLTNPMTFVAFAAVFATMGLGATRGHSILTVELVAGVFAGSALWWTILTGLAHAVRHHFDFRKLAVVNRATGIFVICVGIVYLLLRPTTEPPKPLQRIEHWMQRTPHAQGTPGPVATP